MEYKISIIIPTYNRDDDLDETIDSIISQSVLPYEFIIVDESTDDSIKNLLKKRELPCRKRFIRRKGKVTSSAISRNLGINKAKGDILLFLDDDVTLHEGYLKRLVKAYEDRKVMAVQGYINNLPVGKKMLMINQAFQALFFNGDLDFHGCKIERGVFNNTYPVSRPQTVIESQWLSGCNMSFRKSFIENNKLRFDEQLLRYAFKEDGDISFRSYKICKEKGLKILMNPEMLVDHRFSQNGRLISEKVAKVKFCYASYFFFKNLRSGMLIYYWSILGYMLQVFVLSMLRRRQGFFINHFKGMLYCFGHLEEIKRCDLKEINIDIFGK